ncbi:MAG: DUF362 domain-containing protein [Prolixibacteraceae bacterium]|nr:DUF362 domain-containing protein [Prolixibacteraceae bacterium]
MKLTVLKFIKKFWFRITFIVVGLGSLIWFLIRVIPKPSRATYPCMKAAAPLASSFVSYILGLGVFTLVIKKAKDNFKRSKYFAAIGFVTLGLIAGFWMVYNNSEKAIAFEAADPQPVNQPIGEAKGIFPGRVVWAHNPDATNENCKNKSGDWWYMNTNTNQAVVDKMLSSSIQQLTGATNDAEAWNLIFRYYNKTHGRGDVGYTAGEKIVIKINLNGDAGSYPKEGNINTSPQICLSILKQLVNVAGVAQANIGIGDPSHDMGKNAYDPLNAVFPDVEYWGKGSGRTEVPSTDSPVLYASDGSYEDVLPQTYVDATYMINIPVFKKHHRAGISIAQKNHFGSISKYTNGAWHLHPSLPCAETDGINDNGDYGVYRCFVDIMGHQDLGGKTILYVVDGLWASVNWGHPTVKFAMAPFNNDWTSSLFTTFDPVALESVCFDFLYEEFDEDHPTEGLPMTGNKGPYPHFKGVDDYLHQAASSSNWPAGIKYDPEQDGSILGSLGTHEHWNNAKDKQYTRNLSSTGTGIELYKADLTSARTIANSNNTCSNFPNPFNDMTTIKFNLDEMSSVRMDVYDISGRKVNSVNIGKLNSGAQMYEWTATDTRGNALAAGIYTYTLNISGKKGNSTISNKMMLQK